MSEQRLITNLINKYYEDIIGAYRMIKENEQLNRYVTGQHGESIKKSISNINSNTNINYLYGIGDDVKQKLDGVPLFLIKTYIDMIIQNSNSSYAYHTIISNIKSKESHTDEDQFNYFLAAWLMARAEIEKCSHMRSTRGGRRHKKNKTKKNKTKKNKTKRRKQ